MDLPLYLAMTGAEWKNCPSLPEKVAWMACHFSPYGDGLTNFPSAPPENSLLIVNDRIPPQGHHPDRIIQQLSSFLETSPMQGILLDFQRPNCPETAEISNKIISSLSCPVCVSALYAKQLSCPVFLPPVPPNVIAEDYLSPWQGREIWLEVGFDETDICVTKEGICYDRTCPDITTPVHSDERLCSHYQIFVSEEEIHFCLHRSEEDLSALLSRCKKAGVTTAIGLYQEYKNRSV